MKGIRNFKSLVVSVVLMMGICSMGFGQAEWSKSMKLDKATNIASNIVQTLNENIWVVTTGYYKEGASLIKLNSKGDSLFRIILSTSGDIVNYYLGKAADNGVLLSAYNNENKEAFLYKFDKDGNIKWRKSLDVDKTADSHSPFLINIFPNQNILVTNSQSYSSSSTDSLIQTMINPNGNILWKKNIGNYWSGSIFKINPDNYILTAVKLIKSSFITYFVSIGMDGQVIQENYLSDIIGAVQKDTSMIAVFGLDNQSSNAITVRKYKNNVKIYEKQIFAPYSLMNPPILYSNRGYIVNSSGDIVLIGSEYTSIQANSPRSNAYITIIDGKNGEVKNMERFGGLSRNNFNSVIEANDSTYIVGGWHNFITLSWMTDDNVSNIRIIKTKAIQLSNKIKGSLILDSNSNCQTDSSETKVKAILIQAQNSKGESYYGVSQNDGTYDILASGDSLTLTTQPNSPYYEQTCTPATVKFTGASQTIQKDLFLQKNTDCPYLSVNIATLALRPCFDGVQVVNFCNHGSATAQNAYIEVKLDANLTYLSSTKTAIAKGNNLYRFDLGNIPIDSCGQFTITTKVACDNSLLGKTLCNSAHIFPDSLCAPQDLGKIQVTGTCNGTTIDFNIKNVDAKAMKTSKNYIVIEDHVMFKQGSFNLNGNQSQPISIQAQAGKTYRLIAEQTNPIYGNLASIAFENCNVSTTPTTGMINQFAQGDDSPFEDIDCRVVTASFDPNDKQAIPQGINNQHFIAKNTDFEYMIRFQNTGTDTAFLVILKDTLSQHLDPATIEPGASSHPYKFDLTDRGIAKFIFSGINLPHEKANKEGSNGFVKFRIKQRRDVANGTVINNRTAIYFDYNDPIFTNTTFHTIGESWAYILPNKEVASETLEVKIFPNPFSESVHIEAQISEEHNNLIFNLLDSNGREIRSENFTGNTLDFQRNSLQSGFYFYEIKSEGKRLGTGKLVVF
jgi:hypothetical protein